jgi:hypothetical protein
MTASAVMNWSMGRVALNAICPYYTMFPLNFPLSVLAEGAQGGDSVFDPFCGRGTTLYAARLHGLRAFGIDSNPVAVAIAQSKLVMVMPAAIVDEARSILAMASEPLCQPQGEFWELAYHPSVLRSLCQLREALMVECVSPVRVALRATVLGCLHGPRQRGEPSYLSNQAPRTYAPKPRYAVGYWRRHHLYPPKIDVIAVIAKRAARAYADAPPATDGQVVIGDSRTELAFAALPTDFQPKWIITSPPYYGMRTYGPDQWLRGWFLGGPDAPDYRHIDQINHGSQSVFSNDLRTVWQRVAAVSASDAHLIIRFGGINDRKVTPLMLIRESLVGSGWQVDRIVSAGTAMHGKRQADHFTTPAAPLEEHDIWAVRN